MLELNQVYNLNCLDGLKQLDNKSIHCAVTSPPYFQLRDYKIEGQIGLENTIQEYLDSLVKVFAEVHRVLRDDGTFWLNIGDSYAANRTYQVHNTKGAKDNTYSKSSKVPAGLKPKDLIGVPWRLAFALQDFGWYLRSDIIWAKGISFNDKYSGSCMPEAVNDRPTKSHEYLFLLTKSPKYYYDSFALKEKLQTLPHKSCNNFHPDKVSGPNDRGKHSQWNGPKDRIWGYTTGRNIRTVWTINPKPFKGAHFATMPPKLIEPCIKAGTSEFGCCKDCGKPYKRLIEKGAADEEHKKLCGADSNGEYLGEATKEFKENNVQNASEVKARILAGMKETKTIGWAKDCKCKTNEIKPCVTIDPFFGAGTVGLVSKQLGRDYIGFELNPEYCEIAKNRIDSVLI